MCVLTFSLGISKDQSDEVLLNLLWKMHFPYPSILIVPAYLIKEHVFFK